MARGDAEHSHGKLIPTASEELTSLWIQSGKKKWLPCLCRNDVKKYNSHFHCPVSIHVLYITYIMYKMYKLGYAIHSSIHVIHSRLFVLVASLALKQSYYYPGPLFTKQMDVLPQDLAKFRSREFGSHNYRITLKLDMLAALLPRYLTNFRAIGIVCTRISRLRDSTKSDVRLLSE